METETDRSVAETTERNVTIPAQLAARIETIANECRISVDRAMLNLLKNGIAAYDKRGAELFDLTERFQNSSDPIESDRLWKELEGMIFGI
jgi:hypothetical protein